LLISDFVLAFNVSPSTELSPQKDERPPVHELVKSADRCNITVMRGG
jgi:hypothetical protein